MTQELAGVAERVRAALQAADLEAFAELLHPDVRWGAAGDPSPSCQSRQDVLAWYRKGRDRGRRGSVVGVETGPDTLLVSLLVSEGPGAGGREAERWQVLQVSGGLITDIRGYDDRADALSAAGMS